MESSLNELSKYRFERASEELEGTRIMLNSFNLFAHFCFSCIICPSLI